MGHEVKIKDKEFFDNAVKIFIEVEICGETCGYSEIDGKIIEYDFDVDYERYRNNDLIKNDARAWAKKVVNKEIEKHNPSENPVGTKLKVS